MGTHARSYLFVPADRPERIPKACASGADLVIVDLEDAVGFESKDSARAALAGALSTAAPVAVRVNAAETQWFAADLEVCRRPGVIAVVLPKTEGTDDVHAVREIVGSSLPILPLIESAKGLSNAHAIAQANGVERLLFGPIDFSLDMGMHGGHEELAYYRAQLVLASRLANIAPPVDGPTVAIDDPGLLRADVLRAKRSGFGGKLCIHPKQVVWVNEGFSPSAEEVTWARRVVQAAAAAKGAAVQLDGKMIDRPVITQAELILSRLR